MVTGKIDDHIGAGRRHGLMMNLNFQNWSERRVLLAFSLANVLRAKTACTFSTSQLPKVVREWYVLSFWLRNWLRATKACSFSALPTLVRTRDALSFFSSKCSSRNGVRFSTSQLPRSENAVFCTFWLRHVLRATTVCKIFVFHLASLLRTLRF